MTKKINVEKNVRFNHVDCTIEITKQFDKAASRFASDEFYALQEARNAAPNYKVVVKATKSGDRYKGLTYDFMEKYIQKHDEDGSIWNEYKSLRGYITVDGEELELDSLTYGEIKAWFLGKFSEFDAFNASRKNIVAMAKTTRRNLKIVA